MTDPSAPRPVPGPPRPVGAASVATDAVATDTDPDQPDTVGAHVSGLDRLPVAEHVAVFETEHSRLARELSTIDRL